MTTRITPEAGMLAGDVRWIGAGLRRPECVLCTRSGNVWTSDWRGGVARVGADGRTELTLASESPGDSPLQPNGIALLPDGSWLLADLSEARAGVWKLSRSGQVEPFLLEVDGVRLPPTNFVRLDSRGRIWITISTRLSPRSRDYRPEANSGFVVLVDRGTARIVADGLGYTNECALDADEKYLYVNETFARRLTRFRIAQDGALHDRETITEFGPGTFPDGLALDVEGGIWITSIVSNRVIRVTHGGRQEIVLDDGDDAHIDWVEQAFRAGTLGRVHLDSMPPGRLPSISSIAFGGADLRTIHLGCLLGDSIATFRSPVAGLPPIHWSF